MNWILKMEVTSRIELRRELCPFSVLFFFCLEKVNSDTTFHAVWTPQ